MSTRYAKVLRQIDVVVPSGMGGKLEAGMYEVVNLDKHQNKLFLLDQEGRRDTSSEPI